MKRIVPLLRQSKNGIIFSQNFSVFSRNNSKDERDHKGADKFTEGKRETIEFAVQNKIRDQIHIFGLQKPVLSSDGIFQLTLTPDRNDRNYTRNRVNEEDISVED